MTYSKKSKIQIEEWKEELFGFTKDKEYGISIYSSDKNAIKDIKKIIRDYKKYGK